VVQRALFGGPNEQLGAEPEVCKRDAADPGDRLEEVDVVLLPARRSGPLEVDDAGQPIVDPERQHRLGDARSVAVAGL
jgi:hypothetical protein